MRFEFATANRILFGPGTCAKVPVLAVFIGKCAFVVTVSLERCSKFLDRLSVWGLSICYYVVKEVFIRNNVILATRNMKEFDSQLVIGFGGGSALDTGKAIAALMTNTRDPLDYLEVIGGGRTLENLSIPSIAIPTTSGTGSEVTRNAVIAVPEKHIKLSLPSPFLLP
jgi:alcohol dehydrogenase class IV